MVNPPLEGQRSEILGALTLRTTPSNIQLCCTQSAMCLTSEPKAPKCAHQGCIQWMSAWWMCTQQVHPAIALCRCLCSKTLLSSVTTPECGEPKSLVSHVAQVHTYIKANQVLYANLVYHASYL
jgi:hypothetical protein